MSRFLIQVGSALLKRQDDQLRPVGIELLGYGRALRTGGVNIEGIVSGEFIDGGGG